MSAPRGMRLLAVVLYRAADELGIGRVCTDHCACLESCGAFAGERATADFEFDPSERSGLGGDEAYSRRILTSKDDFRAL